MKYRLFNRERETIKKKQMEIPELKNVISEIKIYQMYLTAECKR